MKVSTWVDPDLAERVRRAAEKEDRSVSQWLRLVLERELAGDARPLPAREVARPASGGSRTEPAECQHDDVATSKTPYGVTTWACRDCPATGSHAR